MALCFPIPLQTYASFPLLSTKHPCNTAHGTPCKPLSSLSSQHPHFSAPQYQQCLYLHREGKVATASVHEIFPQVALTDLGNICKKRRTLYVLSQKED